MNMHNSLVKTSCAVIACMLGAVAVSFMATPVSSENVEISTDLPPLMVDRLGAGVVLGDDGQIYVFGGYRYNYTSLDATTSTVMIYNITTGVTSWGASMSNGVAWPSCAKLPDGRIVVMGGYDSTVLNGTKMVRIYTPGTNSWTTNATAPTNISRASTSLVLDGKVYVFGPMGSENSTLIYDTVNDAWSYGADFLGGRGRQNSCAVTFNETAIYVMGGMRIQMVSPPWPPIPLPYDTDYVDIYDPTTDSWIVGPSLNRNKMYGGAALAKDGLIHYYGGHGIIWPLVDEIETLDASTPGATWQLSPYRLSKEKAHFGTVTDGLGRVFLVGGIEYPSYQGIADVEMLLTALVSEVNEIVIASPIDGSELNGTVEIEVEVKNQNMANVVVVDVYVDDLLLESQLGGGATSWTFVWNASGLALDSSHDVLVRAFFTDGTIADDGVSYTIVPAVTDDTIDERLAQIEEDLTAILDAISSLGSSIDALEEGVASLTENVSAIQDDIATIREDVLGNLSSVQTELVQIQSDLNALGDAIASLESATASDLSGLSVDVAALSEDLDALRDLVTEVQAALYELAEQPGTDLSEITDGLDSLMGALENLSGTVDEVEDSVGEAQGSADEASTFALLATVLAALVFVAIAVSLFLLRRKPQD
jgi:N-acetylneuraminic acid mutarotase/outer membrane murein-binding lipoprotein Lpp